MDEGEIETYVIRPVRSSELDLLAAIEIDAFTTLREALGDMRDARAMPLEALQQSYKAGLLLVAADRRDEPFAFLVASEHDDALYVAEIDVARSWQRKGVGRALMLAALDMARQRGNWGVTLTTDRFVPFNAPFYQSLGFHALDEGETPPELLGILKSEIENGMDAERRVAMAIRFE